MHVAVVRGNQSGNAVETGRFAGAVRTEQADGFAAADVKRNIAQYRTVFVFFADIENLKRRIHIAVVFF